MNLSKILPYNQKIHEEGEDSIYLKIMETWANKYAQKYGNKKIEMEDILSNLEEELSILQHPEPVHTNIIRTLMKNPFAVVDEKEIDKIVAQEIFKYYKNSLETLVKQYLLRPKLESRGGKRDD